MITSTTWVHDVVRRSLAAVALWVTLAWQPGTLAAQEHHLNLDSLTAAQLQSALDAELGEDDLREFGVDPARTYPIEKLHDAIMGALSDEGDDDDEQVITQEELDEEMAEAGTTLAQVVWDALAAADQLTAGPNAVNPLRAVGRFLAREDGLTTGAAGAIQAKRAVRVTIERVRK